MENNSEPCFTAIKQRLNAEKKKQAQLSSFIQEWALILGKSTRDTILEIMGK